MGGLPDHARCHSAVTDPAMDVGQETGAQWEAVSQSLRLFVQAQGTALHFLCAALFGHHAFGVLLFKCGAIYSHARDFVERCFCALICFLRLTMSHGLWRTCLPLGSSSLVPRGSSIIVVGICLVNQSVEYNLSLGFASLVQRGSSMIILGKRRAH